MTDLPDDLDLDPDLGVDPDLDLDDGPDGDLADTDDLDAGDADGLDAGAPDLDAPIDLSAPPDPLTTPDVPPVTFGSTVEFPDGKTVEDPYTDALGYVYPDHQSYIDGVNKHTT